MKLRNTLFILLAVFILGACGSKVDEQSHEVSKETPDETSHVEEEELADEADETFTISSMEVTPFEEVDGKTAVKLDPEEWSALPYEIKNLRWKIFYGDRDFITLAANEGVFRYDLKNDQVVWKIDTGIGGIQLHDGFLYVSQLLEQNLYVDIGVIDSVTGEVVHIYEEKDFDLPFLLQFTDDMMLFIATIIGRDESHKNQLMVYNLEDRSKRWSIPAQVTNTDQLALDIGDAFLVYNEIDHDFGDDHVAYAYDKETGEEIFQIKAKTIAKKPVANSTGIYFANFEENLIQLYDFAGNLQTEIHPEVRFDLYQTSPRCNG